MRRMWLPIVAMALVASAAARTQGQNTTDIYFIDTEGGQATLIISPLNGILGTKETLLLDAGEDPNRFNPEGFHSHATPLHQAIAAGHFEVAKLLIERGARLDIKDTIFNGTPLGWAEYCDQPAIAAYIRGRS